MAKKGLLGLLTLFVAISLFYAFRYSQTLTTENILKQWFDMNAPTRFAFVSDQESKKIAVVDVEEGLQVGLLDLQMPAKVMAIEKTSGTLAYSAGGKELILHNLSSHQERKILFSHPIKKILFSSYSELVAIGEKNISTYRLREKNLIGQKIIPNKRLEHNVDASFGKSWQISVDHKKPNHMNSTNTLATQKKQEIVSAVFSPLDTTNLWLIDSPPALEEMKIKGQVSDSVQFLLPQHLQNFSPLAISLDGQFLLFGGQQEDNFFAAIWKTAEKKIINIFPLSASLIQPYADNNNKYLVMIDRQGKGIILETDHFKQIPIDAKMTVSAYATVWLGKRLLLIGDQLKLYQLPDLQQIDEKPLEHPVQSLFVHSNSKIAIFGDSENPKLYLYNSSQKSLQDIILKGINRPSLVLMGAGNTICH